MRNMAYGVTISKIDDIKGKDRIGLAHFKENAYTVIVSKDIKPNDVVCYFEVDSILPADDSRFEFLRARSFNERVNGYLIRKMKMGGVYSFGLAMTSEQLGTKIEPGKVYDEIFKVQKDEDRYDASPKTYKNDHLVKSREFPVNLIPKSDEDNILNNPSMYDEILKGKYYTSIKLEGKSMTVYMVQRDFKNVAKNAVNLCSKCFEIITSNLSKPINIYYKIGNLLKSNKNDFLIGREIEVFGRNAEGDQSMINFAQRLLPFFKLHPNVILQGEFTDPKVQKGIYKNGTNFNVFRARKGDHELSPTEIMALMDEVKNLGIQNVQNVEYIDVDLAKYSKDSSDLSGIQKFVDGLKFKEGNSKLDPKGNKLHEGVVVRNEDMSIHFKIKNRDYSL